MDAALAPALDSQMTACRMDRPSQRPRAGLGERPFMAELRRTRRQSASFGRRSTRDQAPASAAPAGSASYGSHLQPLGNDRFEAAPTGAAISISNHIPTSPHHC